MLLKKSIPFLLFLITLSVPLFSQKNQKYPVEATHFLKFVRDSIFTNTDTLFTQKYLNNKGLFLGAVLIGQDDLSKQEIDFIADKMKSDSSMFPIDSSMLKRSYFVDNGYSKKNINLSKPIFFRNYTRCIFSYQYVSGDTQSTLLFRKEKGKWKVVKKIGGVTSI
jgi:hypothetical protein